MLTLIPLDEQPSNRYDENGWCHTWESATAYDLGIKFDAPGDYVKCLSQCFDHRIASVRRWHQWQQSLDNEHEEKVSGYEVIEW